MASTKLPHDSPDSEPRARINQHSAHHVDVDTEGRKAIEQLEVLSQSSHELDSTQSQSMKLADRLREERSTPGSLQQLLGRLATATNRDLGPWRGSLPTRATMIRIDRFARFSHNLRTCAGTKNRLRLRRRGRLLAGSRVEAEKRLMMNRQYRQDAGLVLLAIAVRAGAVLILQSHLVPRSTYEHGEIAANLLAGHGFSVRFLGALGPTSQQSAHLSGACRPGLRGRRRGDAGGSPDSATGADDLGRTSRTGRAATGTRGGAGSACGQRRGRPDRGAPPHTRLRRNARPGCITGRDTVDVDTCVCISDRNEWR